MRRKYMDIKGVSGSNSADQAKQMGVPYLGRIPFDPRISIASDKGVPFVLEYSDSSAGRAFLEISEKINGFLGGNE